MGEKNRSGVRTELRDGRKILVIDFRFRDKDGRERRYRRDAAVQLRAAALAEAQRLRRQAAEHGTMEAEQAPLTFEQFVDGDFKKLVLPRFKPSTREGYEQLLHGREHGLVTLLGHKRLDAIGIADVRVVEAGALARKARPRYAIVCLHTVLRCAAELGTLAHVPRLPKLPHAPRSYLRRRRWRLSSGFWWGRKVGCVSRWLWRPSEVFAPGRPGRSKSGTWTSPRAS